ncbi:type I-E CRISPR-associated protein Cas5/CasD [Methylovulum psychrotolerans]|jgi:CRISPR system Cascade subunit CasD|uniref:CRISPR system Cascade subunit CasD n=1 Tax=Methylovulum psychrotolerans TaxID=1704499 RepID=A0A2S5CN92_9GAMM|nr:type I-E CRISPR-associated protein Cas5/CasD [Methylovulum psychrotolerans]MBT9100438.1 type I-E CRISPR-associated protein Cas5/CasD [Methylovulum psychrotolerans]POZ51802.1 CRISPR system Cascade subunit CasD [Methylovulum psychrotolerans]POZ52290.1 CRISPR system Cascade subunit CasD [Methylovulum psychrotolerans]POZ53027.1 CRISPR system Cascade subunit CasD [Methylovulum psychrotolerans]
MDLLLFRLYGAMASWGEIAVGENRHTAHYPSKSALLGLLGAALGLERQDEEQQRQLQEGYAMAVESFTAGHLLRDYHTAQVPDAVGKFIYRTRRDEIILGKERLGTILSSREYRTDALAVVAVRALADAPFSLAEIQEKLLKPMFHLYLGRKSCPLSAPLNPQLLADQPNFLAAFKAYRHCPLLPTHKDNDGRLSERDSYWLAISGERHYYWEGTQEDFSDASDLNCRQTRIRHDQPLSRKRWQFMPRQEHYLYQGGK